MDGVKMILKDSGLSDGVWAEALLHFMHNSERVCHEGQNKTPYELYMGRTPSVKHLRAFGTVVYISLPRQQRSKLQMRAKKGILVGYALKTRGYHKWILESKKLEETMNIMIEGRNGRRSTLKPKRPKCIIRKYEAKEVIFKNYP